MDGGLLEDRFSVIGVRLGGHRPVYGCDDERGCCKVHARCEFGVAQGPRRFRIAFPTEGEGKGAARLGGGEEGVSDAERSVCVSVNREIGIMALHVSHFERC